MGRLLLLIPFPVDLLWRRVGRGLLRLGRGLAPLGASSRRAGGSLLRPGRGLTPFGVSGQRAGRGLLLLLLVASAFGLAAQEGDAGASGSTEQEPFAGLTVVAHGDQEVDIFTGVTTLPEGGEIIDRENGISLDAGWISYREGEFVEARDVRVTGEFGVANADEVYIDLTDGRLDASGQVRYERDDLGLTASALHYFPSDGVVGFEGPVAGVGAEFEAAAAYFDGTSGVLVLAAPYRYQDVLFELSSDREGALMAVTPSDEGALVASSSVSDEVRERLDPYMSDEGESEVADESSQP